MTGSASRRWLLGALLFALIPACKKEAPKPKRTEPWPAEPGASASAPASAAAPVRYTVSTDSSVRFELPARESKPRGRARLVRGEIVLDPSELTRSEATIEVDLGSIVMDDEDAGSEAAASTERALSWLDIGSSRPESERARLRWAKFELGSIEDLWSSTPRRAKAVGGGKDHDQLRRAPLTALGQLSLHGFRVPARAVLEVDFVFEDTPPAEAAPRELVIRTRQPLVVSLAAHDIQPRDSTGVQLAHEAKLMGVRVGREARVSLELRATRKP